MPTVHHTQLRRVATSIFEAVDTPVDIAAFVADSLVDANLAGHDSHGVLRLPGYCASLRAGDIVPNARASLVKRDRATAIVDGALGWGQPAMRLAAETTSRARARMRSGWNGGPALLSHWTSSPIRRAHRTRRNDRYRNVERWSGCRTIWWPPAGAWHESLRLVHANWGSE